MAGSERGGRGPIECGWSRPGPMGTQRRRAWANGSAEYNGGPPGHARRSSSTAGSWGGRARADLRRRKGSGAPSVLGPRPLSDTSRSGREAGAS
eukprot:1232478-Pyramimonas_sp.AAC.1